ncbi:MAG TPA: hypothetical protein VGB53_00800 [Rubricoccaceae bacterium]|jgi:hypothetical protein
MAVTLTQFAESGGGDLAPYLFPVTEAEQAEGTTEEDKLDELLAVWITQGQAHAAALPAGPARDAAVEHWVYYRAFRAVFFRLSSNPSQSQDEDGVKVVYSKEQIAAFGAASSEHRAAFEAALAPPPATTGRKKRRLVTTVVSAMPDFSRG